MRITPPAPRERGATSQIPLKGGWWLASSASPFCSLHYVTPPAPLCGRGSHEYPDPAWAAFSIWRRCMCVCVCVFMHRPPAVSFLCCVSLCGPCVDRLRVFRHLAAGLLACRENQPELLCPSSLGRIGPPPYPPPPWALVSLTLPERSWYPFLSGTKPRMLIV